MSVAVVAFPLQCCPKGNSYDVSFINSSPCVTSEEVPVVTQRCCSLPCACLHHPRWAAPCSGSSPITSLGWLCKEKIHGLAFIEYFNACRVTNHYAVLLFLSEH